VRLAERTSRCDLLSAPHGATNGSERVRPAASWHGSTKGRFIGWNDAQRQAPSFYFPLLTARRPVQNWQLWAVAADLRSSNRNIAQGGRAGGGCGDGHPVPHPGRRDCAGSGAAGKRPARLAGAAPAARSQPGRSRPLRSGNRGVVVLLEPSPAAGARRWGGGTRQAQRCADCSAGAAAAW